VRGLCRSSSAHCSAACRPSPWRWRSAGRCKWWYQTSPKAWSRQMRLKQWSRRMGQCSVRARAGSRCSVRCLKRAIWSASPFAGCDVELLLSFGVGADAGWKAGPSTSLRSGRDDKGKRRSGRVTDVPLPRRPTAAGCRRSPGTRLRRAGRWLRGGRPVPAPGSGRRRWLR
jgi:hypothetical protein